jgi:hypothetical protein
MWLEEEQDSINSLKVLMFLGLARDSQSKVSLTSLQGEQYI